ncbi:hypothetical protein D3C75_809310 [compost metagenome]
MTGIWQPGAVRIADYVQFHILANQSTVSIDVSAKNDDVVQSTVERIVNQRFVLTVVEEELSRRAVRDNLVCFVVDDPLRLTRHILNGKCGFTNNRRLAAQIRLAIFNVVGVVSDPLIFQRVSCTEAVCWTIAHVDCEITTAIQSLSNFTKNCVVRRYFTNAHVIFCEFTQRNIFSACSVVNIDADVS